MSHNPQKHDPSFYRGLIREKKSKKGRHPTKLLSEARAIQDPYYASLALFRLSDDPRLPLSEAKLVAREALRLAEKESRLWRRAELYGKLAKYAKTWNKDFSNTDNEYFLDEILNKLQVFPKGKGLSQNINEISKHIGCSRLLSLLTIAISNNEFILEDSKTVIRQWATTCFSQISPEEMYAILIKIKDSFLQSKLLGYLYLQCSKKQIDFQKALQTAIKVAFQLESIERQEALRYLSRHVSSKQDFLTLKEAILSLSSTLDRVQLLATLAGQADKNEFKDFSLNVFIEALEESKKINDITEQTKEQVKIAEGFLKIQQIDYAKKLLVKNHQSTNDKSIKSSIEKMMTHYNLPFDKIQPITNTLPVSEFNTSNLPASTGNALGLYDTYQGSIKPIHIRTLARAAPLCAAFGLDLALIGFPISDVNDFIKQVTTDTTIGKGGKYLQFLLDENRIHFYSCSHKKLPLFRENEIVIATTAHPDKNKSITLQDAIKIKENSQNNKLIVIMGLGKKGLSNLLLQQVDYHLELTGLNVPLETCTAMGIITMKMHQQLQKKK